MERKFEEMVAAASKAVESMRAEYEAEHAKNMSDLRATWNQLKAAGETVDLTEIYRIGHDVKGQAGTFDRHVLTEIAGLLCRLVMKLDKSVLSPKAVDAIECHVVALELVTRRNVVGNGGAAGAQLVNGLKKLADVGN